MLQLSLESFNCFLGSVYINKGWFKNNFAQYGKSLEVDMKSDYNNTAIHVRIPVTYTHTNLFIKRSVVPLFSSGLIQRGHYLV